MVAQVSSQVLSFDGPNSVQLTGMSRAASAARSSFALRVPVNTR